MARLASDHYVLTLLFLSHNVAMAGLASIVTGKGDRPGRRLSDGRPAIVPILPKAARDDGGSQDYECNHRYRHDRNEPNEVFYVFEQVRLPVITPSRSCKATE